MVHLFKVRSIDRVGALAWVDLLLGVDLLGLVEVSVHLMDVGVALSISLHHSGAFRWLHHGQDL